MTLQSLDVNNNPVSGIPVTISISSAGRLVGMLSAVTDTSGDAVFSNLAEDLVGTFTLKATSQGMSTTSNAFAITAASAAKVTFVTQPTTAVAGSALKAVSVLVTDRFGNIAANATVNIGLLSGSLSGGTLDSHHRCDRPGGVRRSGRGHGRHVHAGRDGGVGERDFPAVCGQGCGRQPAAPS